MKFIKTLALLFVVLLATFNDLFSQYNRGNEVIILVPKSNNPVAPLPLYTPDFNQMNSSLNQLNYNYEQELNRQREIFNAMSPEEQRIYIQNWKAQKAAEEAQRIREAKYVRKFQTVSYVIVGIALLTYYLIK
jgi:hypothetical protein